MTRCIGMVRRHHIWCATNAQACPYASPSAILMVLSWRARPFITASITAPPCFLVTPELWGIGTKKSQHWTIWSTISSPTVARICAHIWIKKSKQLRSSTCLLRKPPPKSAPAPRSTMMMITKRQRYGPGWSRSKPAAPMPGMTGDSKRESPPAPMSTPCYGHETTRLG